MKIIAIKDVIGVNEMLAARGVAVKVHLHDACGGQTLSLEALDGSKTTLENARSAIEEYFTQHSIRIEFDTTEGTTFHTV